jgi:hypothetical protein
VSHHDIVSDTILGKLVLIGRPDLKNVFQFLNVLDFGYPSSNISTVVIVVEGLLDGVEDTGVSAGVVSNTCHVLPVCPVRRHVVVD